jgi:hypothetical protein
MIIYIAKWYKGSHWFLIRSFGKSHFQIIGREGGNKEGLHDKGGPYLYELTYQNLYIIQARATDRIRTDDPAALNQPHIVSSINTIL